MFDAIHHDYLRAIVFGFFHEGNVDNFFESYKFSVKSTRKSLDFTNSMDSGHFETKVIHCTSTILSFKRSWLKLF